MNNAAKLENVDWQPFDQWTVEEWDEMLDVNLRGMWFCARAFVPLMKAQGYGKIVNVTRPPSGKASAASSTTPRARAA